MPAISLIDSIPSFVTQEEYTSISASTPASFNDLPAILKYKEENASVTIQPPVQGFSDQDAAQGTLYVLTSVLVFASSTGRSFQVEYPSITLHAISRSPGPSIYCQLDEEPQATESSTSIPEAQPSTNGEDEENDGEDNAQEDEFTDVRELNIVPSSAVNLDAIFEALSQCAALHPDKLSDDEDMDDGTMIDDGTSPFEIFTGDGDEELSEVGKAALAHLESIIYDPFTPKEDDTEKEASKDKE